MNHVHAVISGVPCTAHSRGVRKGLLQLVDLLQLLRLLVVAEHEVFLNGVALLLKEIEHPRCVRSISSRLAAITKHVLVAFRVALKELVADFGIGWPLILRTHALLEGEEVLRRFLFLWVAVRKSLERTGVSRSFGLYILRILVDLLQRLCG